ncbi:MAG: hypothetical protein IJU03_00255 [Thermoguttaceae bacterium]|nr:hypothetical protein [Thermoguttaceae bacterium]
MPSKFALLKFGVVCAPAVIVAAAILCACSTKAPQALGQIATSNGVADQYAQPREAGVYFRPGLMRVDISIASSNPTIWDGEIRLSRGVFDNLVPLGSSVTAPTDFDYADQARSAIAVRTRAPSAFCGVEATVFSPLDARLDLKLNNRSTGAPTVAKTVFINRLVDSAMKIPLDENGSCVEITRAPADDLPARIEKFDANGARVRESSFFAPNETLRLLAMPRSCSTRVNEDAVLVAYAVKQGESAPFWKETRNVPVRRLQQNDALASDPNANLTPFVFDITAPQEDGVFEITLELVAQPTAKPTFALPTTAKQRPKVFARRSLQGVVLSTERVVEPSASLDSIDSDLRMELLETIDPTNASWRKSFLKRGLLPFRKLADLNVNAERAASADASSRATFASEASDSNGLLNGLQPSFLEIRPNANADQASHGAREDAVTLGQSANADSSKFGVNLLSIVPKSEEEKRAREREEMLFRRQFVQRWERDQYARFLRNLDRSLWGVSDDLWERPLSSERSRPFTQEELALYAPPQTKYLRLEPNGGDLEGANYSEKRRAQLETFMNGAHFDAVSWEAYPIPIQATGSPHLLEIEYPASFPQQLSVTILEANQYGALLPSSVDLGLVTEENSLSDRSKKDVARYALLFWPKTKTPVILLANCSKKTPAAYGQIRVYRANEKGVVGSTPNRGRVFGLALTKPNLCDHFSAQRAPSYYGLNGAEDWRSFEQATSRALYYLAANNFDAMTLAVAADGSALYPSAILNPSPRYDGGVYLASGGDSIRKDVLSYLLARFETRNKSLVPIIKLNGSLPALERRLNASRAAATAETRAALEGIEWIGPNGKRASEARMLPDGSAQYYNVLHPEVEKVALAVVAELTARCAPFDSFGGLALDVGADGWLALPDDVYMGMDDVTIARFVRESNLTTRLSGQSGRRVQELLLAKGEDRYRQRAEFIRDVCLNEWLAWRIDALHNFYRKARETAAATRPDARLYLLATNALDGPYCKAALYPSFTGVSRLREALRLVGLDPARYANGQGRSGVSQVGYVAGAPINASHDDAIAFLRPEVVAPTFPLAQTATTDQLATLEALALFSNGFAYPGAIFLHNAEKRPLYDFNAISPFRPTVAELRTRALPSGYDNRKRFARALVYNDQFCFFDGGEAPAFGQEDTLREWIYVFKSLPAAPFVTWQPGATDQGAKPDADLVKSAANTEAPASGDEKTLQPIVARYYRSNKETWIYLLNVAPFHVGVKMSVKRRGGADYETFTGLSVDQPTPLSDAIVWNYSATPYDLAAIRIDDPNATIESIEVTRPSEICGADGRLFQAVQAFVDRALVAKSGVEQTLRNGNFEESFTQPANASTSNESEPNASRSEKNGLLGLEMPSINLFKTNTKQDAASSTSPSSPSSAPNEYDFAQIPGWRAFGPNDVQARLDLDVAREGKASLKLSSAQNSGGVICQPFPAPTTGRLCVQALVGTNANATSLPLNVCVVGRRNGELFNRRVQLERRLLSEKEKALKDERNTGSILWLDAFALFDRLPLDGLDEISLRFELCGPGEVWLDQIRVTKLAFAESEQPELMRIINTAEFRANKSRVIDVMFMLDGYWKKLLQEEIPDDSPLLVDRPQRIERVVTNPEPDADQEPHKGIFNRAINRLKIW